MRLAQTIRDPRMAPIQVTFRIPWHYKVQLDGEAEKRDTTVPQMIIAMMEDIFPPEPLKPIK